MVRGLAALLLLVAAPAAAEPVVTSPAAEAVSVTIYRNPSRALDEQMDLGFLGGYALITETRTVDLPAGPSVIRFEGVAGNIIPVSAIVSGLPGRVPEKNYDARLLSPGALIDSFLGRQVHIRRTSRATGKVVESEAIIRSGPDGIVLQTPEGVEALRCTGLPETLAYPGVPEGLSDKPTLAVATESAAPARATLTLSYLAGQFDWQADYVANLSDDGRSIDLFAWLTLANGNDESFVAARTQAVAGVVHRVESEGDEGAEPVSPEIELHCWPAGTTSDIPYSPFAPPPPIGQYDMLGGDIVVTGSRIRNPNLESSSPVTVLSTTTLENLGDLKLYRIPEPVTVAANGQKQFALLTKSRVPVERLNGIWIRAGAVTGAAEPTGVVLRTRNVESRRLGLPLPMGNLAVFEQVGGRSMLTGRGAIADSAVGQEVEIYVGDSSGIFAEQRFVPARKKKLGEQVDEDEDEDDEYRSGRYEVEVSNATSSSALIEVHLRRRDPRDRILRPSRKFVLRDGEQVWRVELAANRRATLSYTYVPAPDEEDEDEDD